MIVYTGSIDDAHDLVQFVRREGAKLRALKRLVVSRDKTLLLDVNRDGIEFPGRTYGSATLEVLLRELGVVFTPRTLHNPEATPGGVKEFRLSACPALGGGARDVTPGNFRRYPSKKTVSFSRTLRLTKSATSLSSF
jgi:hypothetical protein